MSAHGAPRQLLLVEPSAMVRGIIVSVTRELQLAEVHQTGRLDAAEQWLERRRMDGIFLAMHEPAPALDFLRRVRDGETQHPGDVPVVAMVPHGQGDLLVRLTELRVSRLLSLPFRIREVIEAMHAIWPHTRGTGA